jgi:hypothetical protein
VTKITEGSTIAVRAEVLMTKLREVATEIRDDRLTPRTGQAINWRGEPVCAFGHAVCRAAKEVGIVLVSENANYHTLVVFLNGDYEDALAEDDKDDLRQQARSIERTNDRVFSLPATPTQIDRREVASAIEEAADRMEAILLPKPCRSTPEQP